MLNLEKLVPLKTQDKDFVRYIYFESEYLQEENKEMILKANEFEVADMFTYIQDDLKEYNIGLHCVNFIHIAEGKLSSFIEHVEDLQSDYYVLCGVDLKEHSPNEVCKMLIKVFVERLEGDLTEEGEFDEFFDNHLEWFDEVFVDTTTNEVYKIERVK